MQLKAAGIRLRGAGPGISCHFSRLQPPPSHHIRKQTQSYGLTHQRSSSTTAEGLRKTPLFDLHVSAGAKMAPFAGFSMPLYYKDQPHSESHKWTRANASLFDVSHMVQHTMSGPRAEEFLMTVTPSPLNKLEVNQSCLSAFLNDEGGIVDDLVITKTAKDTFYFVTNAGNRDADAAYLAAELDSFFGSQDETSRAAQLEWVTYNHNALLALQGPAAASILQSIVSPDSDSNTDLSTLFFGSCRSLNLRAGSDPGQPFPAMVSRTGYTGEDGFEIAVRASDAQESVETAQRLAKALLGDPRVRWAGLAAWDSLRLEAGMCLYGHDIDASTTPPAAGLGWIVGKDRRSAEALPHFKGKSKILQQIQSPKEIGMRRVGLKLQKGPAAREGAEVVNLADEATAVGRVTSGCPSPSLGGQNIAMALVSNGLHKKGTQLGVRVRGKILQGEVVKLPFVESRFYQPAKAT